MSEFLPPSVNQPIGEQQLPQTPAQQAGLIDGEFQVVRSSGAIDSGWTVESVGTDMRNGVEEKTVFITKPKIDEAGNPVLDEQGNPMEDTKDMWLSDLHAMQQIDQVATPEVNEAEAALEEIGEVAVKTEIQLDDKASVEDMVEPETDQDKQVFERLVNESFSQLSDNIRQQPHMTDPQINWQVGDMIEYAKKLPEDLQTVFNGVAIGTLRSAKEVYAAYDQVVREKLSGKLGAEEQKAIRYLDSFVEAIGGFRREAGAMDAARKDMQAAQLGSDIAIRAQSIEKALPSVDPATRREITLLLQGMVIGLVPQQDKQRAMQYAHRTLLA